VVSGVITQTHGPYQGAAGEDFRYSPFLTRNNAASAVSKPTMSWLSDSITTLTNREKGCPPATRVILSPESR
jgi:hypothetical protein